MKRNKIIMYLITILVLSVFGCASQNIKKESNIDVTKKVESKKTVDDGSSYYIWDKGVVEVVKQPPMIVNGVYIPSHEEPVILNPGGYRKVKLNVKKKGDKRVIITKNKINYIEDEPKPKPRVRLKIYKTNTDIGLFSVIPEDKVYFAMKEENEKLEIVDSGGIVKIGSVKYIVKKDKNRTEISFLDNGELKKKVIKNHFVFVTKDGYIVKPY